MSQLATIANIPLTPKQVEKLRRDRERTRKQTQRDAARAAGIPTPGHVDAAIVEAVSFAFAAGKCDAALPAQDWFPVNMAVVMAVAEDILVSRHRYDRARSKTAIRDKLASRPEHHGVDYVPTTKVRPGEMGYRTAAPVAISGIVRVIRNSTPVTCSGRVPREQRATEK